MSDLGNKKIFSENLKHYMNMFNIKVIDLSNSLKIPYSTVSDRVKGNTYPRIDKIEILSRYFNIEKSDLIEDKSDFDANVTSIKIDSFTKIKIYGNIPAGTPVEAIENISPEDVITLPTEMINSTSKRLFGLRISGDSMYPKLEDGDIVIIDPDTEPLNRKISAVYVNGYDATVKQILINTDNTITLHPINPEYQEKTYPREKISLIGHVISMYRNI